jgi:hypothetical protein
MHDLHCEALISYSLNRSSCTLFRRQSIFRTWLGQKSSFDILGRQVRVAFSLSAALPNGRYSPKQLRILTGAY